MKYDTMKKIKGLLELCPAHKPVSEDVREQIAAELILGKSKHDVWDYLDDSDIVYQLAHYLLSGKDEEKSVLVETMKVCLMKF